jgi:hypothetical protein
MTSRSLRDSHGSGLLMRGMIQGTMLFVVALFWLILEAGIALHFVCKYMYGVVGRSRRDRLLFQWSGKKSQATLSGCLFTFHVLSLQFRSNACILLENTVALSAEPSDRSKSNSQKRSLLDAHAQRRSTQVDLFFGAVRKCIHRFS